MAAPLWRLGAQSASRRPLYRGNERKGDFEAFMPLEVCVSIVDALNLTERLVLWPRYGTPVMAYHEEAKRIKENMP